MDPDAKQRRTEFERAGKVQGGGVLRELYQFIKDKKKYWLIPIILVLLALGALIVLGGTAAAPFIYTLF